MAGSEAQQATVVKTLQRRKVPVAGLEVSVEPVVLRSEEGTTSIRAVGLCGKSGYAGTLTVEPNPETTREKIEQALNDLCVSVARQAAGREKVRRLTEELD